MQFENFIDVILHLTEKKKHWKVTGKRLWWYEYMKIAMEKELILKISRGLSSQSKGAVFAR